MTETPALDAVVAEHLAAVNACDEDATEGPQAPCVKLNQARRGN